MKPTTCSTHSLRNNFGNFAILTAIRRFGSLHSPRRRFFRRLSPFPFAGLLVVASHTALDHFVAKPIACRNERGEVAAAEAKRAERHHNGNLQHRLAPARKDRPVWFDLPKMNEAKDAVSASAAIVAAVAGGDLTPSEAAELSKVIDGYARSLQTVEFEERLSKLEKVIAK